MTVATRRPASMILLFPAVDGQPAVVVGFYIEEGGERICLARLESKEYECGFPEIAVDLTKPLPIVPGTIVSVTGVLTSDDASRVLEPESVVAEIPE